VSLNFDLLTPQTLSLHAFDAWTTCANLHQNWFIRFQNIVFTNLVTDGRTDRRTGREHYPPPASMAQWSRKSIECSKGPYSSSWNSPQNYGTPLVSGITQCYLPPDGGDCPAFTPTGQVGTRFIDPVRMKGWVGLVGWLHTEMVYPSTEGDPSWY